MLATAARKKRVRVIMLEYVLRSRREGRLGGRSRVNGKCGGSLKKLI